MSAYLAVTRADVADYLSTLLLVYFVLIFIRIILTWIPRIPYNPVLNSVLKFVQDVTDPYLNIFRRFIPPIGMFDISPIIAIFVLTIVTRIVVSAIQG